MIQNIDTILFNFINQDLSSGLLDFILIPLRYQKFWIPFYVFIIGFFLLNRKHFHWISLLMVILTVGFSDTVSSKVVKPLVERPRPCHNNSGLETVNIKVRCGGGYSFTSSHATNHFALATILFLIFGKRNRKYTWYLFLWAGLVSLAQVYVGVHYPIDITCGALLGMSIGFICFNLYKMILKLYFKSYNYNTPIAWYY